MVLQRTLLVGVAGLLLLCSSSQALFQDQAGTFDWYKAYVGHVHGASFHKSKPRLFVATEQGSVAALNLRDGSIAWRHLLKGSGPLRGSLNVDSQGLYITLTGSMLRAWEHADGALAWEVDVGADSDASTLALAPSNPPSVVVLAGGQIQVFETVKGTRTESVKLTDQADGAGITLVQPTSSSSVVFAFAYTPGSPDLRVYVGAGGSAPPATLTGSEPLSPVSAVGQHGFAALSSDFSSLCTAKLGSTDNQLTCVKLSQLAAKLPALSASAQLVATEAGWVIASGNPAAPGAALLKASDDDSATLSLVASFDRVSAASAPVHTSSHDHVGLIEISADGSVLLQYASAVTGAVVASEGPVKGAAGGVTGPGRGGAITAAQGVKRAVAGSFKRKDGSDGFRLLLVWADERVALVQQSVTVWAREEALAGVTSAQFIDLPAPSAAAAAAEAAAGGSDFSRFVRLQILSAKVQFKLATPAEEAEAVKLRAELSDRNIPTRDARGFRRGILVATESGRVAALHNGDGRMLWSIELGKQAAPKHVLPWTTFHDLTHAPRVALLGPGPEGDGSSSATLTVLDTHTGAVVERVELPLGVDKVVPLGHVLEGHAEQSIFLGIASPKAPGALPQVILLPDTSLARAHITSTYRSTYFWLESSKLEGAPALQGFGFDATGAEALGGGAPATPVLTWALSPPQPVLAVAARDPQEPCHSSVKVLGDRSIKYRYLNPNTLVVVTGSPPGTPTPKDDIVSATIMVVDAVTGRVLHSQSAPGARGPATALVSENSAVVQLWDTNAARFTVTSLELYDATPRPPFSVDTLLDTLFNPNATAPWSSLAPPPLEVLTASFYTMSPAKQLATTVTRAGITSKLLLMLTTNDQVYALDARFVDPRRPRKDPKKMTAEEMEERLIPYSVNLPLQATQFTTYDKQVLGLRGLVAAPARLESTSLLFSWGLDLQYTRVAPAKGFDSLDDDFSYGLLVVALVGLTLASIFMRHYTRKAQLSAKWA